MTNVLSSRSADSSSHERQVRTERVRALLRREPSVVHDRPDVYFTPEYGAAESCRDGLRWVTLDRYDGMFQMPLLLRPLDAGLVDAISPYGYSGAYAHPDLPSCLVRGAWDSVLEELRDLGAVSLFLRHSPLVRQAPITVPHVPVVRDHLTVAVRSADTAVAWTQLTGRCRTAIRKARQRSASVELRPATRDDLEAGSDFRRLYEETMTRRNAESLYFYPDEYYRLLLEGLGQRLMLARGFNAGGEVHSVALFLRHGKTLHYHLAASSAEARTLGLNNLLVWEAVERAAALGLELVHLGGGINDSGLIAFKESFSPHRLVYAASGVVIDSERYAALSRRRTSAATVSFFPAYRATDSDGDHRPPATA